MAHLGLPTWLSVIESGLAALAFTCPAHREVSSATGDRQLCASSSPFTGPIRFPESGHWQLSENQEICGVIF